MGVARSGVNGPLTWGGTLNPDPVSARKMSDIASLKGLSMALAGVFIVSTAPTKVSPEYQLVNCFEDGGRVKFSPVKPEQGMKLKSDSLNPACLVRNSLSLLRMASNLAWSHSTVSSLLTATQSWLTPRLRTKSACSRV